MDYSAEYRELLKSFTSERNLDYDLDEWPEDAQRAFGELDESLMFKYLDFLKSRGAETESDDFYMIDVTVDTEDGPDYSTIDVRTLSLEKLSKLCSVFPQYNKYYFNKVAESL
jgi:hypothetical protein